MKRLWCQKSRKGSCSGSYRKSSQEVLVNYLILFLGCLQHLRYRTACESFIAYYQCIHQVLEVVNPAVKYKVHPTDESSRCTKISGVAIVLKEFLLALDNYSVPHESEKQIRKRIRKRSDCQSHMKQFFLRKGYKSSKICRLDPASTKCKTCICIPRTDVPDSFFESFSNDSKILLSFFCELFVYSLSLHKFHNSSIRGRIKLHWHQEYV